MAIDKRKTSPALKVMIIAVAVLLVLAFMLPLVSPNFFAGGNSSPDSAEGSGQLEAIAASYAGSVAAFEQQLASDPTSHTVLVNLGNTYSDWANDVMVYQGGVGGAEKPMWISATVYYERALEVDEGSPAVRTDLAIAYYYAGQFDRAVEVIEAVKEADPEFAPAYYNSMIFYGNSGMSAEAAAAAARYLELDPQGASGGDPATAQRILDESSAETTSAP